MGYDKMREHLKTRLGVEMGQTTGDGRFTLLPVVCLGACDRAPTMIVDGQLHANLDPPKIDEILERYK
jgi:NADH-quinone oxidoreductase subunit E